jgi:hypothetical protein
MPIKDILRSYIDADVFGTASRGRDIGLAAYLRPVTVTIGTGCHGIDANAKMPLVGKAKLAYASQLTGVFRQAPVDRPGVAAPESLAT